ncbi:MAG: hypothetical protein ACFFDY_03295 [Candidatus Thorarchaeota archaeon]
MNDLLNSIKKFLFRLKPEVIIQAPSRINLINPLDAVEGDYWMPSVAINGVKNPLSAFFYIKNITSESRLKIYEVKEELSDFSFEIIKDEKLLKNKEEMQKHFKGPDKLIYASIVRFIKMSSYFEKRFLTSNIEIGLITTIPLQSGLGGSAAVIISILYGFSIYFNILNNLTYVKINEFPINKDIIAEMATKIEDEDLKITAGYADRYVISRGGLSFCSYYGKLYHKKISEEPLATYDRIDNVYDINDIPIIVCYSGVLHESGDVHERLRKIYLKNDPDIIKNYNELAIIAWKSRFAIMCRNWKSLAKYFKENTRIMNIVMKQAGFKYGIGLANNILINIIEEHHDVYAAKLTGAGGGGSVFALVNPNKIESVLHYWKEKLNELIINKEKFLSKFPSYPLEITNELKNAQFFRIKIDKNGVKKL